MRRRSFNSAFSLVELLVATAVTTVLLVILLGITQNFLTTHGRSVADAAMSREANFALDMLAADLGTLAYPRGSDSEALRITAENVNGVLAHWVTFQAFAPDSDPSNLAASPRAVSYRLGWQDPVSAGGSSPAFALYRSVAGTEETVRDGSNLENAQTAFWTTRPTSALGDYLAGQVAGFRVRLLSPEAGTITEPDASGQSVSLSRDGLPDGSQAQAAEVSVTLLTRQAAELVQNGTLSVDEAIERFGRTYSRQVALPDSPDA